MLPRTAAMAEMKQLPNSHKQGALRSANLTLVR